MISLIEARKSTNIQDVCEFTSSFVGKQAFLNLLREHVGGVSEELMQNQIESVITIHEPIFQLTNKDIKHSRDHFDGRRLICLASIGLIMTKQFAWTWKEAATHLHKHQPNLRVAVKELKKLYPRHPSTSYLIEMYEKCSDLCSQIPLI